MKSLIPIGGGLCIGSSLGLVLGANMQHPGTMPLIGGSLVLIGYFGDLILN